MGHWKHCVGKDLVQRNTKCWEFTYRPLASYLLFFPSLYPLFGSIQNLSLCFFINLRTLQEQLLFIWSFWSQDYLHIAFCKISWGFCRHNLWSCHWLYFQLFHCWFILVLHMPWFSGQVWVLQVHQFQLLFHNGYQCYYWPCMSCMLRSSSRHGKGFPRIHSITC